MDRRDAPGQRSPTQSANPSSTHGATHVDVVIIGAGLSGIGAAYRLQQQCPDRSYVVLEARGAIGGTWDTFRYPGIRSDSDIQSFCYPFRPWQSDEFVADGDSIRRYIEQTAADSGIAGSIHVRTRVVSASWSSEQALWTIRAIDTADARERTWTCAFLYACAGYYDHERGHEPAFPGREEFVGRVVHPQHWPDDLDHSGARVVVIGSGATAVTLVPALTDSAAHVTMLQRSPSWVISVPRRDRAAQGIRRTLPPRASQRIIRARNIALSQAFYSFCRRRPERARQRLTQPLVERLGAGVVAEHFTPRYDPWAQRLCVMVDGDLVRAIRQGRASIVTEHIDRFVPEGVRLASGRVLEADLIVTATGLELRPMGGITLAVDGRTVDLAARTVLRGTMISGVPNFAFALGYSNASWTLRADLSSRYVCRFLNHLTKHAYAFGVPADHDAGGSRPLIGLSSGYVQRGVDAFPRQGTSPRWAVPQSYLLDLFRMRWARVASDMRFVRA